ncbi:hypothetical protein [Pectobacterium aroidearum]|uniref:hypothetical protein n=1 Tax=Pectobacterium aroidearum TaxID=1201031 RepID=UPI003314A220
MAEFFASNNVKNEINNTLAYLKEKNSGISSDFEKLRYEHLKTLLNDMMNNPTVWDEYASYNLKIRSDSLFGLLKDKPSDDDDLNYFFSIAFCFLMERLFKQASVFNQLTDVKLFVVKNLDRFTYSSRDVINYSLNIMLFELLRNEYHGEDIQSFKKAAESERLIKERIEKWDGKLGTQIGKVKALQTKLDEQETAYNFVGLYHGYDTLSKDKKAELNRSFIFTLSLAFLVLLPFSVSVFLVCKEIIKFDSIISSLNLLPVFTLTFVFIYYFRISLVNYISIKAQVNQIELRKTLCSFIQKYSEYAKEMKANDGTSLEKFESIIFSNIMPSEDKIPSTFDGIEQIAKLIESIKK